MRNLYAIRREPPPLLGSSHKLRLSGSQRRRIISPLEPEVLTRSRLRDSPMKSSWLPGSVIFLMAAGIAAAQTSSGDRTSLTNNVPATPRLWVESLGALRPDGLARAP